MRACGDVSAISLPRSGARDGEVRTLPKDGRAGRGFIISFISSSVIPGDRDRFAEDDFPASVSTRGATTPSSKLTRALFFFLPLFPSWDVIDIVSEVSLPLSLGDEGLNVAAGELVRMDDDGECFNADFAGDTDLPGGLCWPPGDVSMISFEKCADLACASGTSRDTGRELIRGDVVDEDLRFDGVLARCGFDRGSAAGGEDLVAVV